MEKTRKEESRRIVCGVQSVQPTMQQTMEMRLYTATSTTQEKRIVESNESLTESAQPTPQVDKY